MSEHILEFKNNKKIDKIYQQRTTHMARTVLLGFFGAWALLSHCGYAFAQDETEKLSLITKRLKEHMMIDDLRCRTNSSWASDYTALHAKILASSGPKLLVAVPHLSGRNGIVCETIFS